ncbi:hypothetical protein L7F22_002787 [Adiantum nelumboides]|nr:hypothetical protein [Adiantum nelumboides]
MKYGMADYKPNFTPLDQNLKLRIDEGEVLDDATLYCKIVGSLIYMAISRPDLSHALGLVSQFMQLPRKPHLDAMRRIVRIVRATLDYTLFYDAGTQVQVHGYTDLDWVGKVSDCRSTNGYMFSFGSATITWSSKKHPTVELLSTEVQDPVVIYCDNLSNIQLAQNLVFHARTKHIEVHNHFIIERVLDGDINLAYVNTEDQTVDLFTKALGAEKLQCFRGMLELEDMALSLRRSVEISSSMST